MMKLVDRPDLRARIESGFRSNPVVLLLGPRQCGKTTLAREFARRRHAEYFDLESPADLGRLAQPIRIDVRCRPDSSCWAARRPIS